MALDVGQQREGEIPQLVVVSAPGEVDKFRIDAAAENLSVSVLEFLLQLCKANDLGGADKGEIFGPEEVDLPLARLVSVRDGAKCRA